MVASKSGVSDARAYRGITPTTTYPSERESGSALLPVTVSSVSIVLDDGIQDLEHVDVPV